MKNFSITHIFILFVIMACSSQTAQSQRKRRKQVVEAPKPDWVLARPITSLYYVGIGYSSTRVGNYQQAAKSAAFEDLLSEIKVNISSTSVLYQMDKKNSFRDEYESTIKSTVKNEIEDYEVMDSYENATEFGYWVYYRLSKSKYTDQKRKKVENALAVALDFFRKAEIAEKEKEISTAIDFYAKTILSLKDYWGENLQVSLQGKSTVMLSGESYTRIQQILDKIILSTPSANIQLKKQLSQSAALPLKVTYNKKPLRSLPILAKYVRKKSELTTTEKGETSILLDKIDDVRNSFTLSIEVQLSKIIGGNEEDKFYKFLLQSFRSPSQTVTVYLAKPTLFVMSNEKNLGNAQKVSQLRNQLKATLTAKGYTFINVKEKAEVILEIEADTRQGAESNGIFFSFLTANLRAIDAQTKKEIFNETMDDVKGGHTSFERAGTDAYQKAMKKIQEVFAEKLIEIL